MRKKDQPRQCFVILATQCDEHGYIPSLVVENEAGHSPMTGRGEFATPWYWGKTLDRAEAVCARFNKDRYGISEDTAWRIVASSMHGRAAESNGPGWIEEGSNGNN